MLVWGNKNIVFEVYVSYIFIFVLKCVCLKFVLFSVEVNNIDINFK